MKHKWLLIAAIIVVASTCLLLHACNNRLQVTEYYIEDKKVQNPIKLAIVADLHASQYGDDMHVLIDAINAGEPDVILLCGDIFDTKFNNDNVWTFLSNISSIYPCYFVSGNHEIYDGEWETQKQNLHQLGIITLSGTSQTLTVGESAINIYGIDDIAHEDYQEQLDNVKSEMDSNEYNILLSHRPHLIEQHASSGADLVISGHAHGGQWRIPLFANEGLYAPSQGILPQYTAGIHTFDNWQLLVSRGLDKQSVSYPRVFNRPELIFLTIQ